MQVGDFSLCCCPVATTEPEAEVAGDLRVPGEWAWLQSAFSLLQRELPGQRWEGLPFMSPTVPAF